MERLSRRDRAIIDLEREWWMRPEPKESQIRGELGLSPAGYYRRVALLLEGRAAFDYDPLTVSRLRRRRLLRRQRAFEGSSTRRAPR